MPLNIPMQPTSLEAMLKGAETGGNIYSKIMSPIIAREHQAQQKKQFEEEMKLRQAQFARGGMNSDLQRQLMQQQLLGLQHKNDPMYDINRLRMAASLFGKHPQGQGGPQELMGQGMGAFSPEGLQGAQQEANQQRNGGMPEIDMEMFKNPLLRGWFKHNYGIDPLAGEHETLHGPARDAADLDKVKKQYGQDSEIYQNAKAQYDASLDAKKDLRDLRARTKSGLKVGEKEFFDPESGVPLGKEMPLTAKERESEQGNILFNELYPYVYKGASPFSGEGSIQRLEQAASNYKTDPKARKMFDDFLLSEKMLAATTVNEASTLSAGRTNRTYGMLKESLDSQDIPNIIKKVIKQYGIPAGAQLKASMRYQKILSDARKKSKKNTPATQKLFYNPEMQSQYESQKNEGAPTKEKGTKVINGVTYYPDGQGGWEHD